MKIVLTILLSIYTLFHLFSFVVYFSGTLAAHYCVLTWKESLKIVWVEPASPAEAAGIQVGDTIIQLNEEKNISRSEFQTEVRKYQRNLVKIAVKRGEETKEIYLTPRSSPPLGQGHIGVQFEKDERPFCSMVMPSALRFNGYFLLAYLIPLLQIGLAYLYIIGMLGIWKKRLLFVKLFLAASSIILCVFIFTLVYRGLNWSLLLYMTPHALYAGYTYIQRKSLHLIKR